MTEPAQVRLKIDPELHNEFKAMCMRSGVSMADQTARMITQFLETSRTPEEQSKAVAANAEGDPIDIDRPSHWLEEYVAEMLVEHRDSLLRAMGQLATGKNVNWLL